MPKSVRRTWIPEHSYGLSRRDRRGGEYESYVPDPLHGLPVELDPGLSRRIAAAERRIRELVSGDTGAGLEGVSRLLLRSEAIASSRIEGLATAPAHVAMAELAGIEDVRGFPEVAEVVANNIAVLRRVDRELASKESLELSDLVDLHGTLFGESSPSGLRVGQNWIGGSNFHPLDAEFVPPPPESVGPLIDDLLEYANGATHGPLVQAAIVHAQFETIHPFGDGNGRVGRALIHAVLRRRGLTPSSVLPVSMILHTWSERYVSGLTAYRAPQDDQEALSRGVATWIETFLAATEAAVNQAEQIADDIAELRQDWDDRVAVHRAGLGMRPVPRADSIDAAIVSGLPEHPVLTSRVAAQIYGTTETSARKALGLLSEVGIVHRKSIGARMTGYLAREVLDLVSYAERRLASTRLDTRNAPPTGFAVPQKPER